MEQNRHLVEKESDFQGKDAILEELLLASPQAKNVYELFARYYVGDSVIFRMNNNFRRFKLK